MRRAAAVAVLFLLAFPLPSRPQTAAWTTFSPPGLNFSALFPSTPTSDPPSIDKAANGSVNSTTYVFISRDTDLICGVSVSLYTFATSADAELSADEANFLKGVNGTLLTSQRGVFTQGSEKYQQLTFTFDMSQSNLRGRANVIVVFNGTAMHTYMTMAMLPKNATDTSSIDKFLNSFVFTATP